MRRRLTVVFLMIAFVVPIITNTGVFAAKQMINGELLGAQKYAPPENVFRLRESGKEFILLEREGDEFFVFAKDSYGTIAFDPNNTTKFDPEDSNNIGYLLNHALTGEEQAVGVEPLPAELLPYLNNSREWNVDAARLYGDYTVTCGVSLLSKEEYNKYIRKIGFFDSCEFGWWLRSPRGFDYTTHVLWVGESQKLGQISSWDAWGSREVRPCFYMKEDFFRQVRVDTRKLGSNVKNEILSLCDEARLRELGYTEEEIKILNDTETDLEEIIELQMPEKSEKWYSDGTLKMQLNISLSYHSDKNYRVRAVLDDCAFFDGYLYVKNHTTATQALDPGKLANGVYALRVEVYDGDVAVKTFVTEIWMLKEYTHHFMEEYTMKGFNDHLGNARNVGSMSPQKEVSTMRKIGAFTARDGAEWNGIEKIKKNFNFTIPDTWMPVLLSDDRTSMIFNFAYNNDLYSGLDPNTTSNSSKYGPKSKEEFDNYADYIIAFLDRYPEIKYVEIWNEPMGAGFWRTDAQPTDYAYLVESAVAKVREKYPDKRVVAGTVHKKWLSYLEEMKNTGAYSYFDTFSLHYTYGPNDDLNKRIPMETYIKRKLGGWKTPCTTESGGTTSEGAEWTEEQHAAGLVKRFTIYDRNKYEFSVMYQFNNFGFSKTDREQNFGIFTPNYRPKMGAYSVAQYLDSVSGAIYIGAVREGDIQFHVYWRDAQPVVVAWSDSGSMEVDLKTSGVTAKDMYGKPLECLGGKVVIGEEPVYLTNLGKEWAARAVYEYTLEEAKDFCDYYAVMMGKEPEFHMKENYLEPNYYEEYLEEVIPGAQGYDIIRNSVMDAVSRLEDVTRNGMPTAQEAARLLDEFYTVGDSYIELYQKNEIVMPEREFFGLLFGVQNMAENVGDLYLAALGNGGGRPDTVSYQRGKALDKNLSAEEDKVTGGWYTYTRAMLTYANEFAKQAYDVSKKSEANPQKAAVIISRDEMANRIMNWADAMRKTESVGHGRLMLQMLSPERKLYNFEKNKVRFSLYNFGEVDFSGEIRLYDKANQLVLSQSAAMRAGSSGIVETEFVLNNTTDAPNEYRLQLLSGSDVIYEEEIKDVKIQEQLGVRLKNSQHHLEDMKEIVFEVENYYDGAQTVELEVTAPEGWQLSQSTVTVQLNNLETKEVALAVEKAVKTPYNEYYFRAVARKAEAVLSDNVYPMNFTLASYSKEDIDPALWNGDISGWESAYPVYVSPPENPQAEKSWQEDRMAVRAYARWNENNLYIMARVNDDIHLNYQKGDYIWNGDSVQLAIDADNNKSAAFMSGDREYVFALTDTGLDKGCGYEKDESFDRIAFQVVRNEEEHMTYYLIRLPKEAVAPLKMQTGSQFGMNFAINDADYISREYMDELTYGTLYTKAPIYYYTWSLTGQE